MNTARECVCCKEITQVVGKLSEDDPSIMCVTDHSGFSAVCLNVWVLQTAYYMYRQHYGAGRHPPPIHE